MYSPAPPPPPLCPRLLHVLALPHVDRRAEVGAHHQGRPRAGAYAVRRQQGAATLAAEDGAVTLSPSGSWILADDAGLGAAEDGAVEGKSGGGGGAILEHPLLRYTLIPGTKVYPHGHMSGHM